MFWRVYDEPQRNSYARNRTSYSISRNYYEAEISRSDSGSQVSFIKKPYDTPFEQEIGERFVVELREGADYIVEQSKLIKAQCEQYGLPYYDTSYNRLETFHNIINGLIIYHV
jgi:hypothetical protein